MDGEQKIALYLHHTEVVSEHHMEHVNDDIAGPLENDCTEKSVSETLTLKAEENSDTNNMNYNNNIVFKDCDHDLETIVIHSVVDRLVLEYPQYNLENDIAGKPISGDSEMNNNCIDTKFICSHHDGNTRSSMESTVLPFGIKKEEIDDENVAFKDDLNLETKVIHSVAFGNPDLENDIACKPNSESDMKTFICHNDSLRNKMDSTVLPSSLEQENSTVMAGDFEKLDGMFENLDLSSMKFFPKVILKRLSDEEISQWVTAHDDKITKSSSMKLFQRVNLRRLSDADITSHEVIERNVARQVQKDKLICQNRRSFRNDQEAGVQEMEEEGKELNDVTRCNLCNKSFSTDQVLSKHLKDFHPERDQEIPIKSQNQVKRYKCHQCHRSFICNSFLTNHMRTHTGEKPYKCNHCFKSFTQKGNLKAHMRIHTGERPYKCIECHKSFSEKKNLQLHSRTHTGERPFKCDQCPKAFSHSSHLHKHIRIHTGEKPFKCNKCQKTCSESGSLQSHMRTHTGERPFKCDHCQKSFGNRSNLVKHIRTHTGEKPFKCNQCRRSFCESSSLHKHLRTHTGEKPYKCNQCSKCFIQSSNLHLHMRTHRRKAVQR